MADRWPDPARLVADQLREAFPDVPVHVGDEPDPRPCPLCGQPMVVRWDAGMDMYVFDCAPCHLHVQDEID